MEQAFFSRKCFKLLGNYERRGGKECIFANYGRKKRKKDDNQAEEKKERCEFVKYSATKDYLGAQFLTNMQGTCLSFQPTKNY